MTDTETFLVLLAVPCIFAAAAFLVAVGEWITGSRCEDWMGENASRPTR